MAILYLGATAAFPNPEMAGTGPRPTTVDFPTCRLLTTTTTLGRFAGIFERPVQARNWATSSGDQHASGSASAAHAAPVASLYWWE